MPRSSSGDSIAEVQREWALMQDISRLPSNTEEQLQALEAEWLAKDAAVAAECDALNARHTTAVNLLAAAARGLQLARANLRRTREDAARIEARVEQCAAAREALVAAAAASAAAAAASDDAACSNNERDAQLNARNGATAAGNTWGCDDTSTAGEETSDASDDEATLARKADEAESEALAASRALETLRARLAQATSERARLVAHSRDAGAALAELRQLELEHAAAAASPAVVDAVADRARRAELTQRIAAQAAEAAGLRVERDALTAHLADGLRRRHATLQTLRASVLGPAASGRGEVARIFAENCRLREELLATFVSTNAEADAMTEYAEVLSQRIDESAWHVHALSRGEEKTAASAVLPMREFTR